MGVLSLVGGDVGATVGDGDVGATVGDGDVGATVGDGGSVGVAVGPDVGVVVGLGVGYVVVGDVVGLSVKWSLQSNPITENTVSFPYALLLPSVQQQAMGLFFSHLHRFAATRPDPSFPQENERQPCGSLVHLSAHCS